jgi:hypothetical protein
MNRTRLLAPIVAALLVIPPATALGGDQELKVRVLPADTLAIDVEESIDFGTLEAGQTGHVEIQIGILNTTSGGWQVTVTGGDLTSGDAAYSIDRSNLRITGGDTDQWGDPNAVEAFSGFPGGAASPLKIVEGSAGAYGQLSLDSPKASLDLTVPADTEPLLLYRTVLVYTITPANPDP